MKRTIIRLKIVLTALRNRDEQIEETIKMMQELTKKYPDLDIEAEVSVNR